MEERSNVANANDSARAVGVGEPSTDADGISAGGVLPAAVVEEIPTEKILPTAVWTDRELAEKFARRLGNRGLFLKVDHDSEKGEVIRPSRASEHVQVIQPDEIAELLRLRPYVLAFLKGQASPEPAAIIGLPGRPVMPRPAPKVREPHRVRDLIGRLAGNPDPAVEATACRAIAEALGDHNPESLALFLGLAGDVRRGDLAEAILQGAFEAACGRKAKHRGKVFTATIRRGISSARSVGPPSRGAP